MNKNNSFQKDNLISTIGRKRKWVIGCCLGGFILVPFLAILLFIGSYYLTPKKISRPLIIINSPHNLVQVEAGQSITVQAYARDDLGITRVELWVNGELKEMMASSLEGGISPFPLLADWIPTSTGEHSLTVRAFNTQGTRTHASIIVEVFEGVDNDGDGVLNVNDICPVQYGSAESSGCPPPDDIDSDGISNDDDACPDNAGLPEFAGCLDRDNDGSYDHIDLCPDFPGPSERGGCPDVEAGDSDGDHVPDNVDLAVDEPGLPSHGGAPIPGEGEDEDGDGIVDTDESPSDPSGDLLRGLFWEAHIVVPVEIEALEFTVDDDYEYDSIWCYVNIAEMGMERYGPFELAGEIPLGDAWHWNIYDVLGGVNSAHLMVRDEPLTIELECGADVYFLEDGSAWGTVYKLGSITLTHPRDEWDGTNRHAYGEGDDGRGFRIKYRVCEGACAGMLLQPPVVTIYEDIYGHGVLEWFWYGDRTMLRGYNLYFEGAFVDTILTNDHHVYKNAAFDPLIAWMFTPPCETTYEITVSAYDDLYRESPPSYPVSVTGDICPRRVRVTFLSIQTYDLPDDLNQNACEEGSGVAVGPIDITLTAQWSSMHLNSNPRGVNTLQGICLEDNRRYSIMELIEECQLLKARFEDSVTCPNVDFIEVPLSSDDDLTISALITDWDWDHGRRLWQGNQTFRPDEAGSIEYTLIDNFGGMNYPDYIEILFRIDPLFDEP